MAKRRKKKVLYSIIITILIIVLGFLAFKAYDAYRVKKDKDFIKEEKDKIKEIKKEETRKEEEKQIINKPSSDEKEETKNEIDRKGGVINLEINGEDEITIKKGDKFTDPGFRATYEDGTDASNEVKVEGEVDTSKEGKYTISYSVGNNIILRRIYVE